MVVQQDGTGDAAIRLLLTNTQSWMMGIDNSDSNKFKISSDGTGVETATQLTLDQSGNATFAGNIYLADSKKLYFGAGNDLHIHHDGGNSYITDGGTGSLYIQGGGASRIQVNTASDTVAIGASGIATLWTSVNLDVGEAGVARLTKLHFY